MSDKTANLIIYICGAGIIVVTLLEVYWDWHYGGNPRYINHISGLFLGTSFFIPQQQLRLPISFIIKLILLILAVAFASYALGRI